MRPPVSQWIREVDRERARLDMYEDMCIWGGVLLFLFLTLASMR